MKGTALLLIFIQLKDEYFYKLKFHFIFHFDIVIQDNSMKHVWLSVGSEVRDIFAL